MSLNPDLLTRILTIVHNYAGSQLVNPDAYLASDLGIFGGDAVELLDELEERFGVDLHPLIERGPYERNSFWHRLFMITPRQAGVDVTSREIAEFISERLR